MKCFLNVSRGRDNFACLSVLVIVLSASIVAVGELPSWIRNVEAKSSIEAAFFRMMPLPNGAVAFRRPPSETRPALAELIKSQPQNADLYSLRALEDEQALDFTAAEADWKMYVEHSSGDIGAQVALADFYHRRLRPSEEIKTLSRVASAPPVSAEKVIPSSQQRSWKAFERVFGIIQAQGLSKDVSISQYRTWIQRYPDEPSLYGRFLEFLVAQKEYSDAATLIDEYRKRFPGDGIFPVKAKAMMEYRRGSVEEGLAVYEQTFQPLWAPQLVKSYFDLLRETQSLRRFRDDAQAAIARNPQDLNATARIFYYYQQQGNLEAAQQAVTQLRLHKDSSKSAWTSQELFTCARLLEEIHLYPESARYYFALYNSKEIPSAQETAIAGLTSVLLTAPETPIRFGSGELSMYRDIATMDQGPGYLNGILSLILNTTQPASQYSTEEQRAEPYFHRERAAELLALLDQKFPNSVRRPELHAQLLEFHANSGQGDAVIQQGREFLANFPHAQARTSISLMMADAYSRRGDTKDEFAIYDAVLQELGANAQNVPLGELDPSYASPRYPRFTAQDASHPELVNSESANPEGVSEDDEQTSSTPATSRRRASQSFQLGTPSAPEQTTGPRSQEYSRVLERYLARLAELKEIPAALALLRHEIDRNPDDPGLYERLAVFLDQNRLGAQQEEVYRLAMSRFPSKSWYDKLARLYLRRKKNSEFEQLTRDAVATFQGSELEEYFTSVVGGGPALYLRVNLYAHERFPHNPVFVRNLLGAYQTPPTRDLTAWEALLRQHWFEDDELRNRFFEFLSSSGRLESELNAIRESYPDAPKFEKNPAAATFQASADLWRSHFEESAPTLELLAAQYPADTEVAHTASSVHRSLAYFAPACTTIAARIEDNLLKANPSDTGILARVGDIYADREQFAQAAPDWDRISQVAPGQAAGYLEEATIYWDYFDFDHALHALLRGRERLADPSLYSYEAGAIYENQRDYSHAIEEYVKGALAASDSSAELRLLQLARRPKLYDLVDQATAQTVATPKPQMAAVYLRVKVLEAQNRKPEMELFLNSVVTATTSVEQAEEIETLAQQKSLEGVRRRAMEKQAALTSDPVTRLQLRYALVHLYEERKDFASAQQNVEALYRENPKILGVVRSTVDFYWRRKMYAEAISVLLQAGKDAHPDLASQFTYEAARKSTEAKQFQEARDLLSGLLKAAPYDGEYLAAMADTYSQAGDDAGLQSFYLEHIDLFRIAPLSPDERKAQIATLRRGLIPALTRMNNYSGAVDQYVELINNFPEDDALVTEASLYALRYQRQQQLVNFYAKTVIRSPRDYRWSRVLARTYTTLESYADAIDAYGKAISTRPDRVDLYTARAGLEERLMRFDDAAADYLRIYDLSYKDPQWMEKIAEIRARQAKDSEAVVALKTAFIDGRPASAANDFEVARRLEPWGMLQQARTFAEQGVSKTGSDLLANPANHAEAEAYVQIMTRLRQHEHVFSTLQKALDESAATLPVLKEQAQRQGVLGLTDAQWRENVRRIRIENARAGMASALETMGTVVNTYFTPEERLAFAHFAESKCNPMNSDDKDEFAIPLAVRAALADQEARWRLESLMNKASRPDAALNIQALVDLERRRGQFAELGAEMEQLSLILPLQQRSLPLTAATDAYRSAGNGENELRTLTTEFSLQGLDNIHQERFFQLLLDKRPQELVRIGSQWPSSVGEQAANYVIAHGSAALAQNLVQARSMARPPVWNRAYHALVGLYFSQLSSDVGGAFISALGDESIGQRLAKPGDRSQQLAGNTWFYYGSRYGEYLATTKQQNAGDFLPATLEESPASSSGYLALGDYYAGAGNPELALSDYGHTLELSPERPDVLDSLALAYDRLGDRQRALAQWRQAFAVLAKQLDRPRAAENFWRDFGRTCDQLRSRHLFPELKAEADTVVRAYLHRNGTWLSNAVLQPAFAAQGDPTVAATWLLDVSSSSADPARVLSDVVDASWIPSPQRGRIYERIIDLKISAMSSLDGLERRNAQQDLNSWQERRISYLVQSKQFDAAASLLLSLPLEMKDADNAGFAVRRLQVAAHQRNLDSILAAYKKDPGTAPPSDTLRTAARKLVQSGEKESARKILEFVFSREIEDHQFVAANFLGLADIRLATGDTTGALDLLKRLVLVVGNPFENLDAAAALLEKTGHNIEAVEFLDQLVKAQPWDPSSRMRLARAQFAAAKDSSVAQASLVAIASAPAASYELRVQAASALEGRTHPKLGSEELNFLAAVPENAPAPSADRFYFYEARIKAAAHAAGLDTKRQLLSHCVVDFPRRNLARVPLFEAVADEHSDNYALGILEPLARGKLSFAHSAGNAGGDDGPASNFGEQDEPGMIESNFMSPSDARLTRAQQALLAQQIAGIMDRLGRVADALSFYKTARTLEVSPSVRKMLAGKIAESKSTLSIQHENASRQPLLHEALEQDRVVRPRLLAGGSRTSGTKGTQKP